jgi:serine/threonine protein kinase
MELVRVLAAGGFGIVYLARDHWLDRDVAVKEFLPAHLAGRGDDQQVELRTDADAEMFARGLQSFIAEAKLLAHFSHPAIVKVHRFWEANGTGYMVMPYLRGPTLGQVRRSMSRPPTEKWLRSIMDPLMGALAMLHAEGVYHRDIAPDNVLVCENGLPVLLDFGAARSIGCGQSHSPTAILKPRFAPIEQYAEATHLRQGPWTDIYSLAALIAYLLDGVAPPQSTARTIEDEMQPLQERDIADVSRSFLSTIDWSLSVRPQDRPQSIAELRAALDGGLRTNAEEPTAPPKTHARAARPALVALAGMALAIAVTPLAPSGSPFTPPLREAVAPRASAPARPVEKPEAKVAAVPSTILAPTIAAATSTNETAEKVALRPTPKESPSVRRAKATGPPSKPARREWHAAAVKTHTETPHERCSERGIFARTYCMRRTCREPQFKQSVQCVPFQQVSRLAHY